MPGSVHPFDDRDRGGAGALGVREPWYEPPRERGSPCRTPMSVVATLRRDCGTCLTPLGFCVALVPAACGERETQPGATAPADKGTSGTCEPAGFGPAEERQADVAASGLSDGAATPAAPPD